MRTPWKPSSASTRLFDPIHVVFLAGASLRIVAGSIAEDAVADADIFGVVDAEVAHLLRLLRLVEMTGLEPVNPLLAKQVLSQLSYTPIFKQSPYFLRTLKIEQQSFDDLLVLATYSLLSCFFFLEYALAAYRLCIVSLERR